MEKWYNPKNLSMPFKLEHTEEAMTFFNRMEQDFKEREKAFTERIKQLFDEEIAIGGKEGDKGYAKVLRVFALGYQHGWNDFYSLNVDQKPQS